MPRLFVIAAEERDVGEGVKGANRSDLRLPCLLGQPQRLVGVGFGGARVTHSTLEIGEVGEKHGTVFGDEVIVV